MEVDELRARCRRLLFAADEDRRLIERQLHAGVQQELSALAIKFQLLEPLVESDPRAAKALLAELALDVQQAVDEAARLAERIYPPLFDARSLGASLRAAAASAGVHATVEVTLGLGDSPAAARTVYSCWLDVLDDRGRDGRTEITVGAADGAIAFEIVAPGDLSQAVLERLRDRVEALAGRLAIESLPAPGTRVSGELPSSA
jgi:signal transduction histidine kinase